MNTINIYHDGILKRQEFPTNVPYHVIAASIRLNGGQMKGKNVYVADTNAFVQYLCDIDRDFSANYDFLDDKLTGVIIKNVDDEKNEYDEAVRVAYKMVEDRAFNEDTEKDSVFFNGRLVCGVGAVYVAQFEDHMGRCRADSFAYAFDDDGEFLFGAWVCIAID